MVNFRAGSAGGREERSIAGPLEVLVRLAKKGLIRHIGLSNVTPRQFAEAESIADIVCVQNQYNLAHREDDDFIDVLAGRGVGYVPFFPLGGFTPLQSLALENAARALKATPAQVALAWLLHRSPNILPIPGTSSIDHLRENIKAAMLQLPPEMLAQLNAIAGNRGSEATPAPVPRTWNNVGSAPRNRVSSANELGSTFGKMNCGLPY
jgi:pyridoxine 4-dehydrogenase